MELNFVVKNTTINFLNPHFIVSDSQKYITMHFDFLTDEWNEGEKTVYIGNYPVLLPDNNTCKLPMLPKGIYSVGVGIVKSDGTIIYTNKTILRLLESAKPDNIEDIITPDIYEQIMEKINGLEGILSDEEIENIINDYLKDNPIKFYEIGDGLKVEGNTLSVDTANIVEQDNTKPITSSAVYTTVGNINAILGTI